jgi:fatty-acyl-CoA synthase
MATLAARIERATARGGALTFVGAGDPMRVEWARLHDDARKLAGALQARGVAPGDHVALLGPTTRELVTSIQSAWLCGATVVVLPLPMRLGSIDEFVDQTRARMRNADAGLLVADPALTDFFEPQEGDPPVVLLPDLTREGARTRFEVVKEDPHGLAILQFTSGSTADPKGVMLPHATVLANLDAMAAAARLDADDDVLVSWLPLYHDMGLIGLFTLPMTTGTDLVLAAPQDFLAAPARWMEWMAAFGGTATAGPNFSYALSARALRRLDTLDLSRWRLALNGAEPVDPDAVDAFCAAGARHGLDPRAMFCAFGMAEATLGVTFPEPGTGMVVDAVDRRVLETDRYAAPVAPGQSGARRLARLGTPVPGLEIRIVDPASRVPMADREVGELEVRGTSITPGYYNGPDATAASIVDGWLRTGDLAYLVGGELVVCGRIKDVIIVGGRNVFPEEIERAVGFVDGVRAGNVIAFGVPGRRNRESVVVVLETRADDFDIVRGDVARTVRDAVGLPAGEIVLVRPGTLPKTSSGKLQRSLCRDRYLSAGLELV